MKSKLLIGIPLIVMIGLSILCMQIGHLDYESLNKPPLNPPSIVFSIGWTIFYVILFYTCYKAYEMYDNKSEFLITYYLVIFFHLLWNFLFFYLGFTLVALICLIVLYILSWALLYLLTKTKKGYYLANIPYIVWLLFAIYLNLGTVLLN